MPHMFETGFSVREVPWHGLGKVLNDYPGSWSQARTLAGLDWDPVEEPVYSVGEMYPDGRAQVSLIPEFKQVRRSDTGKLLDIARDGYQLITHDVFGEVFESITGAADGKIKYETAGSLDEGRKVWVLAKLGDGIHLPGDPSAMQPYMALMTSHDGTAALRVIGTCVRIVCMNTWHAADVDASKRGSSYSFKHTKNWRDRIEDAKIALAQTEENIAHTVDMAHKFLETKVTAAQVGWFIKQFAIHRTIANTVGKQATVKSGKSVEERLSEPRVATSLNNTLTQLHAILDSPTTQGIRGTMWGLVQAAGEFSDHHRDTRNRESYFTRTVLTDKEPLKLAAIRIAKDALTNA